MEALRTTGRDLRALPGSVVARSIVLGALTWVADLAALLVVCTAFGIDVTLVQAATLHLGSQAARQFTVTPGAVGIVEVVLIGGLVSLGAPAAAATAAVLLYRVASHWIPMALGGLAARAPGRRAPRRSVTRRGLG
ncbi:flippase-like domain-containing protein [Nakamurella leprariae]|uniref:flippase-like domain-containing protein n=1 Tax=Nakamurella leprariae TaxID=2803911 RepID=UPI0038B2EC12